MDGDACAFSAGEIRSRINDVIVLKLALNEDGLNDYAGTPRPDEDLLYDKWAPGNWWIIFFKDGHVKNTL